MTYQGICSLNIRVELSQKKFSSFPSTLLLKQKALLEDFEEVSFMYLFPIVLELKLHDMHIADKAYFRHLLGATTTPNMMP